MDGRKKEKQMPYTGCLLELCQDCIIVVDRSGKITDVNAVAERVTGLTRNELADTSFSIYFTDPEKAAHMLRTFSEEHSTGDHRMAIRHRNDTYAEMMFSGRVYHDDMSDEYGIILVGREINIQRQNSRYMRALFEASPDPFIVVNSEGKITDVNKATVRITRTPRERIIDSDFYIYFTEPDKARKVLKQVFDKGAIYGHTLTIMDGRLTDVFIDGAVYREDEEKPAGAILVARDITPLKKKEKDLIRANSKAEKARRIAEEAMKAKQQFLANMSHEIRTPMNSIIGFTKILLGTPLDEKQREFLSAIKLSGDTLIVLLNDILDLSKVDAGKMTYEKNPFLLRESISSMLRLFETKIQEKQLRLNVEFDPGIPEVVTGDAVRLRQIILNLISNAVKFTETGSITMSTKLVEDESDRVTIRFEVTDTGIGIPPDRVKSIFEKFEQASSSTARLYGGTGLGLAIVKHLVEGQEGQVHVKSEPGKGSTFGFTLSFGKTSVTKNELHAEEEQEEQAPRTNEDLKHIRVLVAEDNSLNQLLMKTILGDIGFRQDLASDGKKVIEKLSRGNYDIILMDLQMPEMNGFEVTQHIRHHMRSDIPIIALTADVAEADVKKCKAAGMDDYVPKPVDGKLLFEKILALVKRSRSGRLRDRRKRVERGGSTYNPVG
jgi:PAS domain S-box-containing protein